MPRRSFLQKARARGRISVFVGLRIAVLPPDQISGVEARQQADDLRAAQDGVAERVLGDAESASATRIPYFPVMGMTVNAAQLAKLISNSSVDSIEEELIGTVFRRCKLDTFLIHADDVWHKGKAGEGLVIAVLDTGVAKRHPWLQGKVIREACYSWKDPPGTDHTSLCDGGATDHSTAPNSGLNCPLNITDCDHGTHVASIAAGFANYPVGVARGAKIVSVKIAFRAPPADCGAPAPCVEIRPEDALRGLLYVYDLAAHKHLPIAAVNLSFGFPLSRVGNCDSVNKQTATFASTFALLRGVGVAPIAAAGNSGSQKINLPACISTAISIGNSTKGDAIAREHVYRGKPGPSNYGPGLDLLAPGTNIWAANARGGNPLQETGTSQAAPHVAGAIAVLQSALIAKNGKSSPVSTIVDALKCSGKAVEFPEGHELDKPRIDLLGAYNYLLAPPKVTRAWSFAQVTDGLDWSPFVNRWIVDGGFYSARPLVTETQLLLTSTANCYRSFKITANIRRIYPKTTATKRLIPGAGLIIKAKLNYGNRAVGGYLFIYFYDNYKDVQNDHQHAGYAYVFRLEGNGSAIELCFENDGVPVLFAKFNQVVVTSKVASMAFALNGKQICKINDSKFVSGPTALITGIPVDKSGANSFDVNSVSIQSLETAAPTSDPLPAIATVSDARQVFAAAPGSIALLGVLAPP